MAKGFKKGNKYGYHGPQPNSGRKPDLVKKVLNELLYEPQKTGSANGKTLVDIASETILQAMLDRDADGNITPAGERAAGRIWDRAFGKPVQLMELDTSNSTLISFVQSVQRAASESRALAGAVLAPLAEPRDVVEAQTENGHAVAEPDAKPADQNRHAANGQANGQSANGKHFFKKPIDPPAESR